MDAALKRKVAGAAAGLAIAAGAAGVADAVSGGSAARPPDGRQALLNDVAKRLNVSPQKLEDAFDAALGAPRPPLGYGGPPAPGGPALGPGGLGGPPPLGHPPGP